MKNTGPEILKNLPDNPIRMVIEGKDKGMKGFGTSIFICIGISLMNLFFILIRPSHDETSFINNTLSSISIGLFFVTVICFKAYRYCMTETLKSVYGKLVPVLMDVCKKVLDVLENMHMRSELFDQKKLTKIIRVERLIDERFDQMPRPLYLPLRFIFRNIPFFDLLRPIRTSLYLHDNKREASKKLFNLINDHINNRLLIKNHLKGITTIATLNFCLQSLTYIW